MTSSASVLLAAIAAGLLGGCSLVLAWSSLEGGASDGGAGGGADGGLRCDPAASFGVVTRIPGDVNQANSNEREGRLSADEGTLYFSADQGDGRGFRLHAAIRDDAGAFHAMTSPLLEDTPDGSSDHAPFLLADGTTLYFERAADDGSSDDHIYRATRSAPGASFGPAAEVTDLTGSGTEGAPFFSDDTTLYFVDSYDEGIPRTSTRIGTTFTPPVALALPNGSGPVVTGDNRTLYYSVKTGAVAQIHRSTRADGGASWSAPEPVGELNDPQNDQFPTWVSSDGCVIIFERFYQGSYDLFWARK